jgi:O-antigen/teichoic acid export membrane protein
MMFIRNILGTATLARIYQALAPLLSRSRMRMLWDEKSYLVPVRGFVSSSGIYALASLAFPVVSLALVPYLAHHLSPADYGVLAIMTSAISLVALITQMGMSAAFFRAYNHDYSSQRDHLDVLATTLALLGLVLIPACIGVVVAAPLLANLLFRRPSLGDLVDLAAGVLVAQNLAVPGFAWLRAENHKVLFSLLWITSAIIILGANVVLVGNLHLGIAGALIATGCGYANIVVCTAPLIVLRAGIKVRRDVARNLLTFGVPQVPGFISGWFLQLADRYLLGLLGPLAQVASYSVAYSLGWYAMSIVVIGPFLLAWPAAMYTLARRDDSAAIFQLVFRWFSLFLLFAAFGLSLGAPIVLDLLFPAAYHRAAPIIPVIAGAGVLYGIYQIFMIGANVRRKTWFVAVFITIAAVINILLNLFLIPRYGAIGAALSTLIAYAALAVLAYVGNQRIYPIPFEIGRFLTAAAVGGALYLGISLWSPAFGARRSWSISLVALMVYGVWLFWLGLGLEGRFLRGPVRVLSSLGMLFPWK